MVRITRRRNAPDVNSENISPHHPSDKSKPNKKKRTNYIQTKLVFSDKTNLNISVSDSKQPFVLLQPAKNAKNGPILKLGDATCQNNKKGSTTCDKNINSELNTVNVKPTPFKSQTSLPPLPSNDEFRGFEGAQCVSPYLEPIKKKLATQKSNKPKSRSNGVKSYLKESGTKSSNQQNLKLASEDESDEFLGFDGPTKPSPLLEFIKKKINDANLTKQPTNSHLPVYKMIQPSPRKPKSPNLKAKLNEYEFDEIDDDEPLKKKLKRKPILKMGSKKFRPVRKKKKKEVNILSPLNLSNEENIDPISKRERIIPRILQNAQVPVPSEKNLNTTCSSVGTTPNHEPDTSICSIVSDRNQMLYSPAPYQSPKRNSLAVPILRSSVAPNPEEEQPKSQCDSVRSEPLNTSVQSHSSATSRKLSSTINSQYSAQFMTPMYMGSSTPIHSHWTERTYAGYSKIHEVNLEDCNVSNAFGFDEDVNEEICVSPIKSNPLSAKNLNKTHRSHLLPKSPRNKIAQSEVVQVLKCGSQSKRSSGDKENAVLSNELDHVLFHSGESPTHGRSDNIPSLEYFFNQANFDDKKKKKKVVIVEDEKDGDETYHNANLDDKKKKKKVVIVEDDKNGDETYHNQSRGGRREVGYSRNTRSKNKRPQQQPQPPLAPIAEEMADLSSRLEDETDFDFAFDPQGAASEQNFKKPRRSYERPAYLIPRRYDEPSDDEEDKEPAQEETAAKKPAKKKTAQSKKEEQELEKWAKAFNEQCMQVDSFNLVVE